MEREAASARMWGDNKTGKSVMVLGGVLCPKCRRVGQLKHYRVKEWWYYRVDHYSKRRRVSGFRGIYERCCYIGKELPITMRVSKT